MKSTFRHAAMVAAALSTGCASALAPTAGLPAARLTLERQALVERLAAPPTSDWSMGLVNTAEAARLRIARKTLGVKAPRTLQGVTSNFSAVPAVFDGAADGRVSSAPCYSYWKKTAYWVTDSGWVLADDMAGGGLSAHRIPGFGNLGPTVDTFADTSITISNDGLRMYLCSQQGRLFAIDTTNFRNIAGSPYVLGGAMAAVNKTPPVFIDPFASRDDGQAETLYAINNSGVLHRFYVQAPHPGAATLTLAQAYTKLVMPVGATTVYRYAVAPLVFGGKAYVGYWRDDTTSATNDTGGLMVYDTGCRAPQASATADGTPLDVPLVSPVLAPPALDFDDALNPTLAFLPTGMTVSMIDLVNGGVTSSAPLVVDNVAPVSGNLSGYAYSTSGVSTLAKSPDTGCAATVFADNRKFTADVFGAKAYSTGNASEGYGYLRFTLTNADMVSASQLRVVTNANLQLTCSRTSTAPVIPFFLTSIFSALFGGSANVTPARVFRLDNEDATGAPWSNVTLTGAARPPFEDGATFRTANLSAHSGKELPNAVTTYNANTTYNWPAKNMVGGPQSYTFGMAHDTLNEQAFTISGITVPATPHFSTATPKLALTLSAAGFVNPSPINSVSIDAWNRQIFVGNTNCLFKVSYAGATAGARNATFSSPSSATYCLTNLGRTAGVTPTAMVAGSLRFVENITAPLWDGLNVYMADNHPTAKRSTVNVFSPGAPGAPPTLTSSLMLTGATSDAEQGSPYMSYDFESDKLFVGTNAASPLSSLGRAWVLNRF